MMTSTQQVMLPCCAAALCEGCAKRKLSEDSTNCPMCNDSVDPENLIPYRLLRDKVPNLDKEKCDPRQMQVDKFMSISGYKRRQRAFSIRSRSPRGTSPPSPPPPPPPTPPPGIQRPSPPLSVPTYPPPKWSVVCNTSSGGQLQGQPQQSHASHINQNQREQYYDSQKRLKYSRSVDWGLRDYGRARPYISPSDDPLAAFQVLTNNDLRLVIFIVHRCYK